MDRTTLTTLALALAAAAGRAAQAQRLEHPDALRVSGASAQRVRRLRGAEPEQVVHPDRLGAGAQVPVEQSVDLAEPAQHRSH